MYIRNEIYYNVQVNFKENYISLEQRKTEGNNAYIVFDKLGMNNFVKEIRLKFPDPLISNLEKELEHYKNIIINLKQAYENIL